MRLGGTAGHGCVAPLQPRLSGMGRCRAAALARTDQADASEPFPSPVEVFDSGMLRPKKTLLAVFGLTRHTDRLRRLTDLVPCESCSFGPCQYRRAPYRRAPRTSGEQLPVRTAVLDQDAEYSVNRKALKRWAEERLSLAPEPGRLARRAVPLRRNHLHQHGPAADVSL